MKISPEIDEVLRKYEKRAGTLKWLDMSTWDDEPPPERQWAIPDRIPLKQAGLFSGEGGTGKSIIELMKCVAHVLGRDWMGTLPQKGPAIYVGAEDDADELHRRLDSIKRHYQTRFSDLAAGGLRILPLLGQDASLCTCTNKGGVQPTKLYQQLYEAAGDLKPVSISIDTLSHAFSGNELDRAQVYAFARLMQALAMVASGSVTVLSHPSLQGVTSGSGLSGSTAWHGAFRFRLYLSAVEPKKDEQPNSDLRKLEFKKNQYGPVGDTVTVEYQRGLFLPKTGPSPLDTLAAEQRTSDAFLTLLNQQTEQGRSVSAKRTANNFAPTQFVKTTAGKEIGKKALELAMERLFEANKIHVVEYGPPSGRMTRIEVRRAPFTIIDGDKP